MPVLSACNEPGCSILLTRAGRCARHAYRPTSARLRGYSAEHDRESKRLRDMGTLCDYCGSAPMYQLDHEVPLHKGGLDIPSNRRPICKRCHAEKSGRERRLMHRLSDYVR